MTELFGKLMNGGGRKLVIASADDEIPAAENAVCVSAIESDGLGEFDEVVTTAARLRLHGVEAALKFAAEHLKPGARIRVLNDVETAEPFCDWHERDSRNTPQILSDLLHHFGFRNVRWEGSVCEAEKFVRKNTLVTVAVLACNQARFLRQSLASVLNQTHRNLQVIVVDEGSTDGTRAMLERVKGVAKIFHGAPRGVSASVNEAFRYAQGEYFTWTGADNLFLPHAIDVMASALDTHPELGGVYSDYGVIDDDGLFMHAQQLPEFSREELLRRYIVGVSFLMRATAFKDAHQCDADLKVAEDYDLWLKIAKKVPVQHIAETLYLYRFHAKSLDGAGRAARKAKLDEVRDVSRALREKHR